MKTTIYACHGVLAHEKQTVYSTSPKGTTWEKLTVEIPDSLHPFVSASDEICVAPDNSFEFTLGETLTCTKGLLPAVRYADHNFSKHVVALTVIEDSSNAD